MKITILISLILGAPSIWARGGDWQRLEGATYIVPVSPELSAFATLPMGTVKRRIDNGRMKIEYDLPRELTGRAVEIEALSTDATFTQFSGDFSRMTCDPQHCTVNYPTLTLDEAEVRAYLQSQGMAGAELDGRMQVFNRFRGGDPAGIILFPTRAAVNAAE